MKELPIEFFNRMKELLSEEEYSQFVIDCEKSPYRGIRINTLKCSAEKVKLHLDYVNEKTPFSDNGYYIPADIKSIGDEPFHHAGAFYVQEPSACSAVTVLNVQKGDRVLDLCAAPGGKSTQIAAELGGTGLLWSNEIVKTRSTVLLSNIERMGIRNAVVSCCRPDVLCENLREYFDKVIVDAPCSGEGMFRKEPDAAAEWSPEHSLSCGERQLAVLNSAAEALKSGGVMVYSTCTFSACENEMVVERFLEEHDEFELVDCGVEFGRRSMKKAVRILPEDGGEGHFAAKFFKKGELIKTTYTHGANEKFSEISSVLKLYDEICTERALGENFIKIGDKVLLLPEIELPEMRGLGVIRAGVLFGELKKNRVEPCHAFYMACKKNDLRSYVDYSYKDSRLADFYHGEEIEIDKCCKGFTAVLVEGVTTGFGKASAGTLKNRYPKGLRSKR